MPMELTPLASKLGLAETAADGLPLHAGVLGERLVVAVVTGMGTRLARTGVVRLLDAVRVGHVVVVGITGAVGDETPIGTLVVPETVLDRATGTEHRPAGLGDAMPSGVIATGDDLLTDLHAIEDLRARGVVSLDMETAAVAAVCEERGVPWSVFRAISDRATDGSVDEEIFRLSNQDGTPDHDAIARFVADHPDRLEQLSKLAEGATLAAETAADAAIRACTIS